MEGLIGASRRSLGALRVESSLRSSDSSAALGDAHASCFPGSTKIRDGFANCQTFAYAVLRDFGRTIPDFRSSELWEDDDCTFVVEHFGPLDLILFNRAPRAFGAHVGVFVGEEQRTASLASRRSPAVWRLHEFAEIASYRLLVGGKRTRK